MILKKLQKIILKKSYNPGSGKTKNQLKQVGSGLKKCKTSIGRWLETRHRQSNNLQRQKEPDTPLIETQAAMQTASSTGRNKIEFSGFNQGTGESGRC